MPADLEQWEKAANWVRNIDPSTGYRVVTADPEEVDALVAELRAAREVVKATRDVGHGPTSLHWNPQCIQCRALGAYDKLTEETTNAG